MNRIQINAIANLKSSIHTIHNNLFSELDKAFEDTSKTIFASSDDPKKDGLEISNKIEEIRQLLQSELGAVIDNYQDKLNSL